MKKNLLESEYARISKRVVEEFENQFDGPPEKYYIELNIYRNEQLERISCEVRREMKRERIREGKLTGLPFRIQNLYNHLRERMEKSKILKKSKMPSK